MKRTKIPKYALVRRQKDKWEENLIAGDSDEKGVKVYAYSAYDQHGKLIYKFLKRCKPEELLVVGFLQSQPEFLPKLVG